MSEAEKKSSEKWQKMVKNWLKWSKLPDFDGLRTVLFFHPQRKLHLFWYHQYYSEYESGSQSKAQINIRVDPQLLKRFVVIIFSLD